MYIIVIGWLYVIVMVAATEKSVVGGLMTLFFYGLAPAALFLFLVGTPARRRAQIEAARSRLPRQPLDEVVDTDHRDDADHNKDDLRQGGA